MIKKMTVEQTQLTFTCSNSTIETLERKCEISSKLTIKTSERRSRVFDVNFKHVSHLADYFAEYTEWH